jgi:hypothetical protein
MSYLDILMNVGLTVLMLLAIIGCSLGLYLFWREIKEGEHLKCFYTK